jgi:AcrR family transcriptional regulator
MEKKTASAKTLQTKRLLTSKLVELLEKTSFRKISVNDICRAALISRSTFYVHFGDKYQLLHYYLEKEIQRWQEHTCNKTPQESILYILDAIQSRKNFYYHLVIDEPDEKQREIFQEALIRFFTEKLKEKEQAGETLPCPISVLSSYYAGGIAYVNMQWMQNGFDLTAEEMAKCQFELLRDLF